MKSIFVGNMSFQTTEAALHGLFGPFWQVTRVHVATDRQTGQKRGFAFIEMTNDEEAAKAITGLNGKEVDGRALRVNEATPKTERTSGGGGQRRGESRGREGFSTEDYRDAARKPREPRW
jgi:cold-inducible RNA-binding protein